MFCPENLMLQLNFPLNKYHNFLLLSDFPGNEIPRNFSFENHMRLRTDNVEKLLG